jgi:hypothetical protein
MFIPENIYTAMDWFDVHGRFEGCEVYSEGVRCDVHGGLKDVKYTVRA